MLCEGNSIRSVERMTGIHRDTALPTPNAPDECIFQEAGKLQSGGRLALRLLQFREIEHRDSLHAKHVLDSSRSRGHD
jgi:hypothetical protein